MTRPTTKPAPAATLLLALIGALTAVSVAPIARGQFEVPVYVDDSPTASEAIDRARQLAAVGNVREAIDVFQRLLDEQGERVLAVTGDPDLFESVRRRINRVIASDPALMSRYEELEGPRAQRMLELGDIDQLVSTRLMTAAGFEGALRSAQSRIERAQFGQALIELRELDAHPMRAASADAALDLLDLVCAYAGADNQPESRVTSREASLLRAAWRDALGMEPFAQARTAETPDIHPTITPLAPADATNLAELLPRALATVQVGQNAIDRKGVQVVSYADLRVMPAVTGDTVFVCDGDSVMALDRFTLTVRWRTTLPRKSSVPGGPMGAFAYSLRPIDIFMPAVDNGSVFVIGGDLPDTNSMTSAERVIASYDAETGRLRWKRFLSEQPDETLSETMVRGPVLIDQDTLICTGMRINQQKRVAGAYLFALSPDRGEVLWTRNIGSVGTESAPYFARESTIPALAGGIVYVVDPVGVVGAVEAATGRVRWVRRLDKTLMRTRGWTSPWRDTSPLVHDGKLFIASSTERTIRVLDAWTGEQLETIDARPLGSPDYLLLARGAEEGTGDWLVCVSANEVKAKPIDRLVEPVKPKDVARVTSRGIYGRVVVADHRVLVPTDVGIIVADLNDEDPLTTASLIELEHMGQIVAMPSSLVVADNEQVHSYLVWEQASSLLRQRMEQNPSNATAAVTYAELSYRAGQTDEIVSAVDRSLKAIAGAPESPPNELARQRLFAALLEMIEAGPDAPTPIDIEMRRALLARLDRTAATSQERVAFLMSAGQTHELLDQPMRAVETYQRILESEALATAEYKRGQTGLPAATEATRRIRRLVFEHGPDIYAVFDAEGERELARLNWSLSPEPFEELARRYPVSRAAARAWVEAGDRYTTAGQTHMAIFALEEALRVSRLILPAGDELTGEAVGRLVYRLEASRRVRDAIRILDDVITREPDLVVRDHGRVVDAVAWRGELNEKLARLERRPDIGSLDGTGALIAGKGIVRAEQDPGPGAPTNRVTLYDGASGEISMWQSNEQGALSQLWDGVFGESLVRLDGQGVLFVRPAPTRPRDRVLVMRNTDTGQVLWETEPIRSIFPQRELIDQIIDGKRGGGAFGTPIEMSVMVGELIILVDTDTIVVLERSGRAAGFDTVTGKHLWAASMPIGRVHDASLSGGVLAAGGVMPPAGTSLDAWIGAGSDNIDAVVMLDARTGKSLVTRTESAPLRWVRASDSGSVVFATDEAISMIDPFRATLIWTNSEAGARQTLDAQIIDDRVMVLGAGGEVRQIALADGTLRPLPLDTRDRMDPSRGDAVIASMHGHTVMGSELGVVVFDRTGELMGVDQRATDWRVLPVALAEGKVCTLAQMGQVLAMERSLYEFNVTEVDTVRSVENRRIELTAPPRELAVIDNAIAISTSDGVVVIPAPIKN